MGEGQPTLPFDAGSSHLDMARHFAGWGNVDMANVYLHRYACETAGDDINKVIGDLRTLAAGRCLHPEAIGDPALFDRRE